MLNAPTANLAPGDRAPNFLLPDHTGKVTMFYERVTGRPFVLLFTGAFQPPILPPALMAFDRAREDFAGAGVDLFSISLAAPEAVKALKVGHHLWSDPERKISNAFLEQLGLGGVAALKDGAVAVLMDANQRVLKVLRGAAGDLPVEALAFFKARPEAPEAQVRKATAPVLIIPDLLDPAMCKALMDLFETGNVTEGAVGSVIDGKEQDRIHHAMKKRLDCKIEDPKMHETLQAIIGRRIVPELAKAHNFQGFKFDRFIVCRYAADREDRFRTHRDNISPETADRRFAMTLNLNGDEYEGGELVFPEYGPDRYKPGNGGAVVFSCSLLHEALPVTKGVRFALLTFLRAVGQGAQPRR